MKIYYSVIWIKTVILIGILLMGTHRADMTLDEVEATQQFEIATDATHVVINPEGPLNFLRGYIYQKMDCMYNKRFFAPQIDTKYSLEENSDIFDLDNPYIYTRTEQKDKAHKALPENEMDVYAEKYHNHLINLFPSPTGDITIETRGNQSFVQFLRAKKTEEYSLHILALLLLFSEGVNIPIRVNNTILEVYETGKKDQIYFTVPMAIPWLDPADNKTKNFPQKKVKQMISFFKEYATNQKVLSMMVDKCLQKEVMSGKFLDSPKFLIQSYIFGFIDSAERAIEFIQTVHTMVEKYSPKKERASKGASVYDRLFKPAGTEVGIDCMSLMKSTQEILNTYRVFPFIDSTQLPSYTSVPRYNRETKTFSTNRLEDYSNCVECMILSLFCCLTYDSSDFTYKTNHMEDVSEEFEEFFSPENQPFDTTKAKFQNEWCRVIADLDEPIIAYCKGRNELDCGLINMLLVIAEIVNISKDKKDIILGFERSLKEEKELNDELCDDIKKYTETLLKGLSKTEIVEIKFSDLKSTMYNNERCDISGDITISFKYNGIENTIVLGISEGHSTIDMEPTIMDFEDDRMEKMSEIAACCKNEIGFLKNLFAVYIAHEIRKIGPPEENEEFMKEQVRTTIENKFADINRLLLIKKISDFGYKKNLVGCSIIYIMNQSLSPDDPLIRFTSNIIGSTELSNFYIQIQILPSVAFAGLQINRKPCYPNIKLPENVYIVSMDSNESHGLVRYVLDCDISIFIIWIKPYISRFDLCIVYGISGLLDMIITRPVYEYIFRDQNMEYAYAVDEALARDYPRKKDEIISSLHYIWFLYLISEESPNMELIKPNFNAIGTPNHIPHAFASDGKQKIIEILQGLKEQLCSDKDSIAIFDNLIRLYSPSSGIFSWVYKVIDFLGRIFYAF
ncbi:hypothetical protein NEAUS03_0440 [Nematocida ausubeli]|nr:hypothetical protein NEAUS03_0440 [Nematocida ausubeli]